MANLPKSFIPDTAGRNIETPTSFVPSATQEMKEPTLGTQDVSKLSEGVKRRGATGIAGFGVGIGKGALETLQKAGQGLLAAPALLPGGKTFGERKEEIEKTTGFRPETLEAITPSQKAGKFVERVAEFAVPATKVAKITQGASFLTKLVSRALTSGAVATGQAGELGRETKLAAGTEVAFAAFGPAFNVVRRLFKGLGSGLSGVSTDVIDTIVENPQKAREVSQQLVESGNFKILEDNARIIVNGVSKVRQDARRAFGEGLEKLSEIDIEPKSFRNSIQSILTKFGSEIKEGERVLKNVEFNERKNIKKASELIGRLSKVELNGKSLRKLADDIDASKFKTATSDERLSFNAFINDLSKGLKDSISGSTDKLDEINKVFSKDMQLVEGIERIFSKVKFRSLTEVAKVADKLENLFSQKGLKPRDVDDFLKKIKVSPEEFRTKEAVRQIETKVAGANQIGLGPAEFIQQVTSAVVTPNAVKNISIATGIAEQVIEPLFNSIQPTLRGALIEFIIDSQK